jgi:hypothetical protein
MAPTIELGEELGPWLELGVELCVALGVELCVALGVGLCVALGVQL